jgi:hypothetical protein
MTKRIPLLCSLVLATAGTIFAIDRPVEAYASSVSGASITLDLYNPESTPQTVRVQVSVLVAGGDETLTSANVVVGAGATLNVTLTAGSEILGIGDGPEPLPPI